MPATPPAGVASAVPDAETAPDRRFTVRLIAFYANENGRERAEGIRGYLGHQGWNAVVRRSGRYWVVEAGEFRDYGAAESARSELRQLAPPAAHFGSAYIVSRLRD